MELMSIEYGDFEALFNGDRPEGQHSACLKVSMFVDPALVSGRDASRRLLDALAPIFPCVRGITPSSADIEQETKTIACLTGGIILDLQRDLCEWPGGQCFDCRAVGSEHYYELYVESIDERAGRFSAQLAVQVVRMMLLEERFDPRLIWVIDLARYLRQHPRARLNPGRMATQLGCSRSSAEWAIQELERYGYVLMAKTRRRRAKGGRILIVDDSAQIRDLLSRILEALGHDVITAVNGEEGLILLDWMRYKAIFVDLMMPGIDGFTFLKRAREQGITCPMFVISAYEHRWGIEEMQAAGATDYLPKPFSISEIETLLKKYQK